MTEYTFTFEREAETNFRRCLERLEPDEYNIVKDIYLVKQEDPRYSERECVIEMEPEACLTFRLGMKAVKIRRARSEEELAADKEIEDRHTIRINVQVPTMSDPGDTP